MKNQYMITEQRNPKTIHIDQVSTIEMLKLFNEEDKLVAGAVEAEIPQIAKAVDLIYDMMKAGGRLIYMGAGTSGRIGILDASEVCNAYGVEPGRIIAFLAGGEEALIHSVSSAQDDKFMGVEELKHINFTADDVLLGISSSGTTPYVTGAMEYAKRLGSPTIALTCTSESELSQIADIIIASVVGPEAITGSTRMKSATAHKMVLNMISTGVMIKLGKVYENLMIDIKPSNVKLHNRRTRVVAQALDVENTKAEELLNMSNGNTRLAILMGLGGLTVNQAQKLLETYDNDIKACLRDELCQQEHQEGNHHPLFE